MDEKTHQLLGELVANVRTNSEVVSRLSEDARANTEQNALLAQGLVRANEDLRSIRSDMVTPDKLRRAGLDLDEAAEHRKDFEHLRSVRQAAEERRPISQGVIIAVVSTVALGVAGWAGSAILSHWDTPPAQQTAAKGNN